jgi:ribosomal protein S18
MFITRRFYKLKTKTIKIDIIITLQNHDKQESNHEQARIMMERMTGTCLRDFRDLQRAITSMFGP